MSMMNRLKQVTVRIRERVTNISKDEGGASIAGLLCGLLFLAMPGDAMAAMSIPFIDGIGCNVANWLKGPLAILVFVIVFIVTLVVGMFAKMDWGKIISVVVIYGLIQGFVGFMLSSGGIMLPGCLA